MDQGTGDGDMEQEGYGMTELALKPCPFCGQNISYERVERGFRPIHPDTGRCPLDLYRSGWIYYSLEELTEWWNRRVTE